MTAGRRSRAEGGGKASGSLCSLAARAGSYILGTERGEKGQGQQNNAVARVWADGRRNAIRAGGQAASVANGRRRPAKRSTVLEQRKTKKFVLWPGPR
jgi:hypothetical protein